MDLGLTDRVYIVTGASRGLGWAGAEQLAAEGARLVLCSRGAEILEQRARSLGGPERALAVPGDLSDPGLPERLVASANARYGRLDGALISVGGPPPGGTGDLSDTQWLQVHKIMQNHRKESRPLREEEMALRRGFVTLDPGSANYAQQVANLQDQSAKVARDRVADMASVKSQVYTVLDDAQRAKLAKREQEFGQHRPRPPQN